MKTYSLRVEKLTMYGKVGTTHAPDMAKAKKLLLDTFQDLKPLIQINGQKMKMCVPGADIEYIITEGPDVG